jgi:hypothetical protein
MRVRKITSLQEQLCYLLFLMTLGTSFAQTASNVSPTKVTHRSSVTIQGTGFTTNSRVKFYTTADGTGTAVDATQTIFVSATTLQAILPGLYTASATSATHQVSVRVAASSTAGAPLSGFLPFTYITPVNVGAASRVSEIITNWAHTPVNSQGVAGNPQTFWRSQSATTINSNRPDNSHSVMAFRYGGNGTVQQGTMYSTGGALAGDAVITNTLTAANFTQGNGTTANTYVQGNYRALPIKNITGVVPNTGPNLIVLGSRVDGSSNTQIPTAPNVAGLTVRDVLIDGTRGLNIGTGVTNLPSTSVLTFAAAGIVQSGIDDGIPDILVSQIAEPTDGSFSVYCFTNQNGDIVGNPVQVAFNSITPIGTYRSDFFTLPAGQPISTAHINGSMLIGNPYRDIRMVAYRLADFGISTGNASDANTFKVMPSGTSDPAFMAYNRNSFTIPAPEISSQPQSQAVCPGGNAEFVVEVIAEGAGTDENEYQWLKNGEPLVEGVNGATGVNTPVLTISPVTAASAGVYRCLITNTSGAALSNNAYLNTIINAGPNVAVCSNTPGVMEVSSLGNNPTYQWYKSETNTNSGGVAVPSNTVGSVTYTGTGATYAPPAALAAGAHYYYVVSRPAGLTCAEADVTSAVMVYTVGATATGGTVSPNQSVCPGGAATINVSEYNGTSVQWQRLNSSTGGWDNIPTTGQNGTSITPSLYVTNITATTSYRAVITSTCGSGGSTTATSPVSIVSVNDTYVWTGLANTDWSNTQNWSCNAIPSLSTTVIIPAGVVDVNGNPVYPHVYGVEGLAKTIAVAQGASVTVDPAGTLRVADFVTVAEGGTFVVENNGALVQLNDGNNTGNITVKRNSSALYRLDYTLWSSPVTGQNLGAFSPSTFVDRFYEYRYGTTTIEPATQAELYWTVSPSATSFVPARGYLIRMPNLITAAQAAEYNATNGALPDVDHNAYNNGTLGTGEYIFRGEFTGIANNGAITPPVNLGPVNGTALSQLGHFYATGNPYPSPISVADFYGNAQNTANLQEGSALYFWRKKNNALVSSYACLTLSGLTVNSGTEENMGGQLNLPYYPTGTGASAQYIISPGQGFLVKLATTATGNVTFTNTMRRAATTTATGTTGQPFFRTLNNNPASRYWLNLSDANNAYSQALVAYAEEGTLGVDYGYDGFELPQGNIRFYSVQSGQNFSIQTRPDFEQTDVVPMGFSVSAAGQYTIDIHDKDGVFADGQEIYLKDNMYGTLYNLADGAYSFSTEAGTFASRFEVVYMNTMLGNTDLELNNIYVYKQNGTNTININSGSLELTGVKVFDIRGRELYNAAATGNEAAVNLNIAQQVVIVEATTTAGKVTRKVIF